MKQDIEIAGEAKILPVMELADKYGLDRDFIEPYGKYKGKCNDRMFSALANRKDGKLVLVTAINPTPAGEGKTTTTIGLAQALNKLGVTAVAALREPSLGPCMGVKGGAAGGGYSQVLPMEEINLHFTGDIHAITAAHNLLSAMIDNHLQHGNALCIDPRRIHWGRVMDMNDRSLRNIIIGLGGKANGFPREERFSISVASEVMAILCLSEDISDLKQRIAKIIIGYNTRGEPVTAGDLGAGGSMAALLKDAIMPNLAQTIENTPVFIHGGPFANIAHGCNSVRATRLALKLGDVAVTEAGFGADLGAEKFMDIKCRLSGLRPACAVLVATVRALKYNGGADKNRLKDENAEALEKGLPNLEKHIENLGKFGLPVIVAINRHETDTQAEHETIIERCGKFGAGAAVSDVYSQGGSGGSELAQKVLDELDKERDGFKFLYPSDMPVKTKVETIAREIYGADGAEFSPQAKSDLKLIDKLGYSHFPVCVAKTQYSLSDDPRKLGRPRGFSIDVRELSISAGAGFIVALAGDIMTMPGLPREPAAEKIDITSSGEIKGLF